MQEFRVYLQQEYFKRTTKNPSYSLRSFAQQLGVNHATLSSLISGKRKLTQATIQKLAKALNLGPNDVFKFTEASAGDSTKQSYYIIQQDAFATMSEWYFDAILELTQISGFKMEPEIIASSLGISKLQAKIALETLERLELIQKDSRGRFKLMSRDSTNILDADFTSAANRKYQKSVLEQSALALDSIDRKKRDHTSTTIAINVNDLPKAKQLIQKFRYELNAYLQRSGSAANEVYQLQVAFFPLSNNLIKINE